MCLEELIGRRVEYCNRGDFHSGKLPDGARGCISNVRDHFFTVTWDTEFEYTNYMREDFTTGLLTLLESRTSWMDDWLGGRR